MAHSKDRSPQRATTRRYRSRGVDVEIRETKDRVELSLDGKPIEIEVIDGEFHSQLANQFMAFSSVDEVVDALLSNEGRTWTLRGHVCDERCGPAGHHHDHSHGHEPGHTHGRGQ